MERSTQTQDRDSPGARSLAGRLTGLREHHRILAYEIAVAATLLAATARLYLNPVWGQQLRFFTFYPAIILAAYVGGFGPGVLASLLSSVFAAGLWMRASGSLLPGIFADQLALVMFFGVGIVISALVESMHRATAAYATSAAEAARSAQRLRILREIDQAIIASEAPEAMAEAVIRPLRDLLRVPRAIVNLFDLTTGEAEWLAAAGRRRVHVGPGVRYSLRLMGDVEALRRGAMQVIDVRSLPQGPEAQALLASGVEEYMVVPMIAGGELIGALSFGGARGVFSSDQITIAQEVAAQLAIGIAQARLYEQVKRQAEELERRVQDRTAELQSAQENLVRAERLAILGKIAGGVSHELRNPLGVISNSVYYLNIIAPEDTRIKKHLTILQRETARATRIISGLLDFARVAPPRPGAVDLNAVVRELLDELPVPAVVRVSLQLVDDLPPTVADADHVRHIVANIVNNALQAMPGGGVLTIETGRRGNEVWLAVSDTGSGIEAAHVAKIFDPLFTTKPTGIGLGLAVVKNLADRNAVRIDVESAPGQGARFELTFGFPGAESDAGSAAN